MATTSPSIVSMPSAASTRLSHLPTPVQLQRHRCVGRNGAVLRCSPFTRHGPIRLYSIYKTVLTPDATLMQPRCNPDAILMQVAERRDRSCLRHPAPGRGLSPASNQDDREVSGQTAQVPDRHPRALRRGILDLGLVWMTMSHVSLSSVPPPPPPPHTITVCAMPLAV